MKTSSEIYNRYRTAIYSHGISISHSGCIKALKRHEGSRLLKNYCFKKSRFLGQGANGRVVTAHRKGSEIAVKTCRHPMSEKVIQSCISEAMIQFEMSKRFPDSTVLLKKHIVSGNESHLIMDVSHQSVKKAMSSHEVSTLDDLKQILIKSIDAIQKTHQASIAHQDFKMENLLAAKDSSGDWDVRVFDFGLSNFSETPALDDHYWIYHYLTEVNSFFRGKVLFKQIELREGELIKLDRIRDVLSDAKESNTGLSLLKEKLEAVFGTKQSTFPVHGIKA